jgi:hypothetical protein
VNPAMRLEADLETERDPSRRPVLRNRLLATTALLDAAKLAAMAAAAPPPP